MAGFEQETIVAISTPVGRGGIGIVRVSGPDARAVVAPLLRLRHALAPGRARFGELLDVAYGGAGMETQSTHRAIGLRDEWGTDEVLGARRKSLSDATEEGQPGVLDEVVVTYFAGPHSYTGEDVVEIALHGSPVLLEYVVRRCCAGGARLAEPGEFTQRAFFAGRIDLTQAEAVDDLIGSSTLEQARLAARQMGGSLAHAVSGPKEQLVGLIAALEAGIDFAEDDIDVMSVEAICKKIAEVQGPLAELERSFARGRVVRDGFTLAIVGRPNAGKSSLFNRLAERERAIVTATPGTTRDLVTETVAIAGIPVSLVDTAGLREAIDEAERIGIAKSREAMAEADVVLLVVDASAHATEMTREERGLVDAGRSAILVWNKWDLVDEELAENRLPRGLGVKSQISAARPGAPGVVEVRTSAVTGAGLTELRAAIVGAVTGSGGVREAGMLTNVRQHQAVETAVCGLATASAAAAAGTPHEMILLDLYGALRGLDALTGATTNEDVLRLIFSRFCIGK